jgi:hypothetical protein
MPYKLLMVFALLVAVCVPAFAQEEPGQENVWSWAHKVEIRADYRWSDDERHPTPFPFTPQQFMTTPDPGSHVELNVADVQLDLEYGNLFAARAKVHGQGLHRRNPTSTDRKIDTDELYVRIGPNPEFLERPDGTTFFVQAGKFPKMERQPIRLLESYGLAATSFNRFEDIQVLTGGTVGRSFYWRFQAANGNPLFMRDPNALAGDNGTPGALVIPRTSQFGSGFPILYNAETEDYFFKTAHVQLGEALGYRWQRQNETLGFDLIVFHYQRELADEVELTGTKYGGDLDLLGVTEAEVHLGTAARTLLPISGNRKEETGARLYSEWHSATVIAQYTTQKVAGLGRDGWELEAGYRIPLTLGPIESIQPAVRVSAIDNHFNSHPQFPAPSLRWDWRKYDAGIRIGLKHGLDVTAEYTTQEVGSRFKLNLREALVTVRWRV